MNALVEKNGVIARQPQSRRLFVKNKPADVFGVDSSGSVNFPGIERLNQLRFVRIKFKRKF